MTDDFVFRGNRNYLHSTTLLDYIIGNVLPKGTTLNNIDFSMSRFTGCICEIVPADQVKIDEDRVVGQFTCGDQKLLIVETTEKITRRVVYQEEKIIARCRKRGDKSIVVPADITDFSFIEKSVAAYKELLSWLFGEKYYEFFFIRIILVEIPDIQIEISYDRIISGKYFQATITSHNAKIGTIFFGAKS